MSTATEPRPGVWAAPHLLRETLTWYFSTLALRMVLLLAFACADLVFVKGTIDLVLNENEAISWSIAIMLTIGSVAIMLKAGYLLRKAESDGYGTRLVFVLLGAFLLIGAALVIMRLNGAEWTATAIAVEGQAGAADETAKHQALAFLLGLFFLASGTLSFFEGKHDINPTAIAYLRLKRRTDRTIEEITAQRGVVARGVDDLERAKQILREVPEGRKAAAGQLRYRAEELMALSRLHIANALGDPISTGITEIEPNPFISRDEEATR